MTLTELLRSVGIVAQTGGTPQDCESLGRAADNLADMVGWASGPIDPDGQWLERLAALQADLQHRHRHSPDTALVALNDRLTRLGQAIARHDADLEAGAADADDGEDFP
jgi:hypothetical protein